MNLITSGVMRGLTGAASKTRLADVSMGVYRLASARGDAGGMDRAAGYAAGSMRDANASAEDAQKALEAAQAEARARQNAERRDRIEQRREAERRAREAAQNENETAGVGKQPVAEHAQPGAETSDGTKNPVKAENVAPGTGISDCVKGLCVTDGALSAVAPGAYAVFLSNSAGTAGTSSPSGGAVTSAAGRTLHVTA
jgi:hypothetical protein